jgi:hypothetical protein
MKNFIASAVIIGMAVVICGFIISSSDKLGANPGPEYHNMQYFHAGLVNGGSVTSVATTATAIVQLTGKQFCDNSIVKMSNSYSASTTTIYLPTGPQLIAGCLTELGDTKTLSIWNNASDTTNLIVTASTSIDLQPASGTSATIPSLAGTSDALKGWARVSCVNIDGATSTCFLVNF